MLSCVVWHGRHVQHVHSSAHTDTDVVWQAAVSILERPLDSTIGIIMPFYGEAKNVVFFSLLIFRSFVSSISMLDSSFITTKLLHVKPRGGHVPERGAGFCRSATMSAKG